MMGLTRGKQTQRGDGRSRATEQNKQHFRHKQGLLLLPL